VSAEVVPFEALSRGQRRRLIAHATLRTVVTVALVVFIFYVIPMDRALSPATVIGLVLTGLAFAGVVAYQVSQISRSAYPTARAVEALAFTIPVYILAFATLYYLLDHASSDSFGTQLSRTDSMYFSTTVLTTVGFGDISAKSETARVIVTCQMVLDLLIVGLVVRLIVNAIKVGLTRRAAA
jgi:voltage-gated potassium channel